MPIAIVIFLFIYILLQRHEAEVKHRLYEKSIVLSSFITESTLFNKQYSKEKEFKENSKLATLHHVQKTFQEVAKNEKIHLQYFLISQTDNGIVFDAYSTDKKPSLLDNENNNFFTALQNAFLGQNSIQLTSNPDKKRFYTAFTKVPNTNWVLIVCQPYNKYMVVVFENFFYMFAIIFIIALIIYLVLNYYDTQSRKHIHKIKSRFKDLLKSTDYWIWEVDTNATYTYISKQVENALGYKKSKIIGEQPFSFMTKDEAKKAKRIFTNIVKNKSDIRNLENIYIHKDGHEVVILTNGAPYFDIDGTWMGYRGIDRDITDEKRKQKAIEHLAYNDVLTGLANRKTIILRIEEEINFSKRHNIISGIMFLDLDDFKYINDTLGHTHGDEVLKIVSQRLTHICRNFDTVSRIGGDEFIVLVRGESNDVKQESKIRFHNYINRIVKTINEPIIINNIESHIGVSIGVALLTQDGETVDDLISHADTAMYKAKNAGKNKAVFYNEKLQLEVDNIIELKNKLISAFKNEEFILHYQEQFDLEKNIVGYEALIRWKHPVDGLIEAHEFLPYIEKFGFFIKLDSYVYDKVFEDMYSHINNNPHLTMAINITGSSFTNYEFLDFIENKTKEHSRFSSLITLEVTEDIFMNNNEYSNIEKLKSLGFKISIDDFGTGYSKLSYLSNMKFDEIKIDISFIRAIDKSQKERDICKFIFNMARALNIRVVAEGVETKEEFEFVKNEGANVVQGYYLSKPKTIGEILKEEIL
ncbi:diguanylate cyclase/phosphodiesterase (GGDEF & EAL domains) with PAS/PAC sensor(s) [hydrothermal vent metagenome]|uniref:Diguanylate cyclase/phosphodiesterase (GGDEF & EAL domains) with PAS/PAC sensor(S) n=1 Tax=hydrothermal vent metagenome TaxID=652676 RepID=A0A1W1EEP5_9ZZZZ